MFALAGLNVLGAVLFGAVYAAAGARYLTQAGFAAALLGAFLLMVVLWVRAEGGRGTGRGAVERAGRVGLGLLVAVVGVPVAVLLPLFGLERLLPAEAVAELRLGPVMALVLIALVLVVLVNVMGVLAIAGGALAGRLRARRPPS